MYVSPPREITQGLLVLGVEPETLEVDVLRSVKGIPNPTVNDVVEVDVCGQLTESYESTLVHPFKRIGGTAALKLILQEHHMTGDDRGEQLGIDRSSASKILKNRRWLTAEHTKKLAARLKVAADVFLA